MVETHPAPGGRQNAAGGSVQRRRLLPNAAVAPMVLCSATPSGTNDHRSYLIDAKRIAGPEVTPDRGGLAQAEGAPVSGGSRQENISSQAEHLVPIFRRQRLERELVWCSSRRPSLSRR
jgi:hypothetical protein